MKKSTLFLQAVIVLIGIGALAFLLGEPHLEGRNVNATLFEMYFNDPFLVYAYIASIPFFVALYQAFTVLGYVRQGATFSQVTVKALRTITYCAMTIIVFIVGAEAYFFIVQRRVEEDIAGGVAMGLMLMVVSAVVATTSAMFERIVQDVVER